MGLWHSDGLGPDCLGTFPSRSLRVRLTGGRLQEAEVRGIRDMCLTQTCRSAMARNSKGG